MGLERKQEVITFKVDKALNEALGGIPNRSEFIRNAILAALDGTCPLCKGTGILNVRQQKHWEEFARKHAVVKCDDCHTFHLTCQV
ncbi:MAG: CopG family transcriptional regulator [Bacillota bacterium]|nr:CopG family transcriptional regulator [Bacillota bacterium]